MPVPDETLLAILSDATEGKKVLVIVTDGMADVPVNVNRAEELLIRGLRTFGDATEEQARRFITQRSPDWRLNLRSGGWAFFYPEIDLKPTDDVGNPTYVYLKNNKGRYERISYGNWKARFPPPPEETVPEVFEEISPQPKTSWSRLLEEDD